MRRFFPSLEWYIDSMLTLIERAGEFASKDVWYSTVQLVTNHDELHAYAAEKVVEALRRGASADALLGVSAYILGVPPPPFLYHIKMGMAQQSTGMCPRIGIRD